MRKIDKNIVPEYVSKTNEAIEEDKKFREIFLFTLFGSSPILPNLGYFRY
ncbi:MAG: hypothetical protein WCB90_01600 [Methanosarcina sp.]